MCIRDSTDTCTFQWEVVPDFSVQCPPNRSDVSGLGIPNVSPSITGGTGPFAWAAANLPPGIVMDPSTGNMTGGPTTAGVYNVIVGVTDDTGSTVSCQFEWTITQGNVPTLTVAKGGDGSRNQFQAVGGNYVYEIRIIQTENLATAQNVSILDPVVGAGVTRSWEVSVDSAFFPPLSPTTGTGDISFTGQTAEAGLTIILVTDT